MFPGVEILLWCLVALAALLVLCFGAVKKQPPVAVRSAEVVVTRKVKARRARVDSVPLPRFVEAGDDLEITVISSALCLDPEGVEELELGELAELRRSRVELSYEDEASIDEPTAPRARILVHAQGETHCGRLRPRNEDRLLVAADHSLFAVADGMGGHRGGEVASELAVRTLDSAYRQHDFQGSIESSTPVPRRGRDLALAMQMANHAVHAQAAAEPALHEMGTTLVVARFSPRKQRVYIGHVGDSRCYRIRNGHIRQLTRDHTLASVGVVGPNEHHLVRAIGIEPSVTIDLIVDRPEPDDVYCLCSDGLPKMLTDQEICDLVSSELDLEAAVYSLIELANDRGGLDNITVVLVQVTESASSALSALAG